MNGPGRLSLRARLLVVLIAVTAAFLLIMGGVTAFVLSKRLGAQFDDSLISAAARTPGQIQANPGDDVAVEVTRPPVKVLPLTGSNAATEALADSVGQLIAAGTLARYIDDTPFAVPGTSPRLRAVGRFGRLGHSGAAGQPGQAGIGHRFGVLVVARPVGAVTGQVGGIVVAELITGGALILLLALGGRWLIGRGLAPLSEMAGTAQRITTQGDLTARMPDADGRTEVGRLGAAINTMLDRIQQAFGARLRSEAKVRQFAADASHELRTPLTTIRGYAELYRQGALDDGQLPDAMRRIEQEALRMGTLVAELLELARLDRTTSLDITETDLALLVRDAAADARAVEPARPVRAEAPESLVAAVDEARIRQVLANLLGNVREHTPVTTPTAVRLAQVRGGVVLEVADSGPGMAADDAARAFDRFHRGTERRGGEPAAGPAVGYGADHGAGGAGAASTHSANGSRRRRERGQRARPCHRRGHRPGARRPGHPGIRSRPRHQGPRLAPDNRARRTRHAARGRHTPVIPRQARSRPSGTRHPRPGLPSSRYPVLPAIRRRCTLPRRARPRRHRPLHNPATATRGPQSCITTGGTRRSQFRRRARRTVMPSATATVIPRGRPSHPGGSYPRRAATAASAGARNQVTTPAEAVRRAVSAPLPGAARERALLAWGATPWNPRPPTARFLRHPARAPLAQRATPWKPPPASAAAPAGLGRCSNR